MARSLRRRAVRLIGDLTPFRAAPSVAWLLVLLVCGVTASLHSISLRSSGNATCMRSVTGHRSPS